MARKIKFALEMPDGTKIRGGIEELREHFDLETITAYFLSGKLLEWLDDRYYEDEAEALENLDKDAPDFHKQLCTILGVEYTSENEIDVEALERLNEKKAILRQKTDDEEIIKNAGITALTQEDLANLLDMDEPVIYLCGESFNVPIRKNGRKYIGILGTPAVNIKAKSQNEIDTKEIVFENVKLPWMKIINDMDITSTIEPTLVPTVSRSNWPVPFEKLHKTIMAAFAKELKTFTYLNHDKELVWTVVGEQQTSELDETQKEIALAAICGGEDDSNDVAYVRVTDDLSAGWAFTKDSFCASNDDGAIIIPYKFIEFEEYTEGTHRVGCNIENSDTCSSWIFYEGWYIMNTFQVLDGEFALLKDRETIDAVMKCLRTMKNMLKNKSF